MNDILFLVTDIETGQVLARRQDLSLPGIRNYDGPTDDHAVWSELGRSYNDCIVEKYIGSFIYPDDDTHIAMVYGGLPIPRLFEPDAEYAWIAPRKIVRSRGADPMTRKIISKLVNDYRDHFNPRHRDEFLLVECEMMFEYEQVDEYGNPYIKYYDGMPFGMCIISGVMGDEQFNYVVCRSCDGTFNGIDAWANITVFLDNCCPDFAAAIRACEDAPPTGIVSFIHMLRMCEPDMFNGDISVQFIAASDLEKNNQPGTVASSGEYDTYTFGRCCLCGEDLTSLYGFAGSRMMCKRYSPTSPDLCPACFNIYARVIKCRDKEHQPLMSIDDLITVLHEGRVSDRLYLPDSCEMCGRDMILEEDMFGEPSLVNVGAHLSYRICITCNDALRLKGLDMRSFDPLLPLLRSTIMRNKVA